MGPLQASFNRTAAPRQRGADKGHRLTGPDTFEDEHTHPARERAGQAPSRYWQRDAPTRRTRRRSSEVAAVGHAAYATMASIGQLPASPERVQTATKVLALDHLRQSRRRNRQLNPRPTTRTTDMPTACLEQGAYPDRRVRRRLLPVSTESMGRGRLADLHRQGGPSTGMSGATASSPRSACRCGSDDRLLHRRQGQVVRAAQGCRQRAPRVRLEGGHVRHNRCTAATGTAPFGCNDAQGR